MKFGTASTFYGASTHRLKDCALGNRGRRFDIFSSIKNGCVVLAAFLGFLISPSLALGAGHEPLQLPVWSVAPFVLLLLCIAVLPLVAEHFWHNDRNKAFVVVALAVPLILYLGYLQLTTGKHTLYSLVHELGKYASFIIMLGSLYTVAGGIVVRGDLQATPLTNAAILGLGALLANLIGTTGSSALLIRPFLRINAARKHTAHLPVFFIFLVSNLGGCLTPLGDPPLFMGYLNGVPFTWTLRLWPQFLTANGLVLAVFVVWDTLALRREAPLPTAETKTPERMVHPPRPWRIPSRLQERGVRLQEDCCGATRSNGRSA
jgi:Na+/H+ antiporter NhaD/arsenite permease-like protein